MSDATKFTLDDITLAYSEEDYKPQRKEPLPGLFFELRIDKATVEQSPRGYLQVKLVTEALDKDGQSMFRKWVNVPVPVTLGKNVAPTWSKGLWLAGVRPLFPGDAPYDRSEKDAITGQKIYWKGSEQVKSGKDFDDALTASNKRLGERAKEVATIWIEQGDGAELPDYAGHTVFGKTVASSNGQYINIDKMFTQLPEGAECVYDKSQAFGR